MVNKCIICRVKEVKGQNGPFHRIPKDPVLRNSWLKALNLTEVKEWDRVCGSHFHPTDYWPYRGKVNPLLKPRAVPFLSVYAEETLESDPEQNTQLQVVKPDKRKFEASEREENGPNRKCHKDQESGGTMDFDPGQPDDHVTAGSSISDIHSSGEEMEDNETYKNNCSKFSPKKSRDEILHRKEHLQAVKIKSLEALVCHLRIKMKKQEDRMKEIERRLDETDYLRDLLKLV